jgi:hypothetical protein
MAIVRSAYFWAILLHLAAFVGLGIYSTTQVTTVKKSGPENLPASAVPSTESASFTASQPPYSTTQVAARVATSILTANRMSPTQQLGAAGDYANRLEAVSSVSTMREMSAYLGSTVSWKPPESRAERGQEKKFDHATSMPVGARQRDDGQYVFVFKDANNNRCEIPAAAGDENAAKALSLLDRSDVLREFKNGILLPMLNQRLDAR